MKNSPFSPNRARRNRQNLSFPEVIRVRTRKSSPPKAVEPIDDIDQLRRELRQLLAVSLDKRLCACYTLLAAILERNANLKPSDKASLVAGLRHLKESVGEGPDQLIEVSHLWEVVPPELAPRNEHTLTDLMNRFVRINKLPRKRREVLEREVRVVTRSLQNANSSEARKLVYNRAWAMLQTKL